MLIRFGVSNFRSICDYQEILFTASKLKDNDASLIHVNQIKDPLLASAVIYGANASGKSNFLNALNYFVKMIRDSQTQGDASGGIIRDVFLLAPNMQDEVSEFDVDFITNGVRYHYGFKINNHEVIEEWLYAYPKQKRQVWFYRNVLEDEPFYFGSQLKGHNKTIAEMTRYNSLFLSSSAQYNHEQLQVVYRFFVENITAPRIQEGSMLAFATPSFLATSVKSKFEKEPLKKQVMSFLKEADTGICGITFGSQDMNEQTQLMREVIKTYIQKDTTASHEEKTKHLSEVDSALQNKLTFLHQGKENNISLPFENESQGIQQLLILLFPIFSALEDGHLLIIDELESSMHPLLAEKLVELFDDPATNPNKAQLLYTTHDTHLLHRESLRRDQVWFVEKDQQGASSLYPLTDYKIRKNDPIERGYLQGRFGATPVLNGLRDAMRNGVERG